MHEGKLDVANYKEEFDVITSFEVLEHINNQNEEVEKFHHLLRKGGLFYCTTPNFNGLLRYYLKSKYNIIGYPEHLTYFTKKTLIFLFKNHNFVNVKFLSTGISLTRLRTSKGISEEKYVAETSSDEKLRKKMDNSIFLTFVKNTIDFIFTFFNVGSTLKGDFIKK
jgi:predicted SAM-dependent methyltransferase